MFDFEEETINRLKNPNVKIEDKLYLISRCIEEKYKLVSQPNYWDSTLNSIDNMERIFYKVWLWICYAEWENLVVPISEFNEVFEIEKRNQLLKYLENNKTDLDDLESYYTLNGEAGEKLLNWVLEKLA